MSSQWKNKPSDAAPGTAKRRAFAARPKLGRPVAGRDGNAPRRRRGLFEIADSAFISGGTETTDAEDRFGSRTEPNLVPENGALATDDLDDLAEADTAVIDDDMNEVYAPVADDNDEDAIDYDSNTAILPAEMLDQLKFDLDQEDNKTSETNLPFIPKPRILGKRTSDHNPQLDSDEDPPLRSALTDGGQTGDGIEDFRRGLNEIETTDETIVFDTDGEVDPDASNRNGGRHNGAYDPDRSSTNVHSISEASSYESNNYSASAAKPDFGNPGDNESRDRNRVKTNLQGLPLQVTKPTAKQNFDNNAKPVSRRKLSTPVRVSDQSDDTSVSVNEEPKPGRLSFAKPARSLPDEQIDAEAAEAADVAQLPAQNEIASVSPERQSAELDAVTPAHQQIPPAPQSNPGSDHATTIPAQSSDQPAVETPAKKTRSGRSIREVLKASLKRTPRTSDEKPSVDEPQLATSLDDATVIQASDAATIQDAVLGDSRNSEPGLDSPPEPDKNAAVATQVAARGAGNTAPTANIRPAPVEQDSTSNPQLSADADADNLAGLDDEKAVPAGRYSKALRQKAAHDAKVTPAPTRTQQPAAPASISVSTINEELAYRHAAARAEATETGAVPDTSVKLADTAAGDVAAVTTAESTVAQTHEPAIPAAARATATSSPSQPDAGPHPEQVTSASATVPATTTDAPSPAAPNTRLALKWKRKAQGDKKSADTSSEGLAKNSSVKPTVEKVTDTSSQAEVIVQKHVPGKAVNKLLSTDEKAGTYTVFLPKLDTPDPVERQPLVRDPVVVSLAVFSVLFMLTAATGFVISRDIDVDRWLSERVTDVKSHANDVAANLQNLTSKDAPEEIEQDHTSSIQPVSPRPQPVAQAEPVSEPAAANVQPAPLPTNPNFEFDSENALAGSLISSNGEPVAGEQIVLVSPSLGARFTTTTRDDGEFTLENLMPGDDYNLSISPAGPYKTLQVFDISITESNPHMPLTLEAMPTANLSGRIVDAENNAVPNFQLWATGFDEPGQQVNFRSDHEGNYRLYGLPTGKVQFTSKSNPKILITSVVLNGGADEVVDLVVDYGTHQIGGIATDADGNPLGGVEVTLEWSVKRDSIRSMGTRTTTSDSDGSFRFTELGPGKHFLTARADGLPLIRRSIDVGIDNTEIALSLGATSSDAQIN